MIDLVNLIVTTYIIGAIVLSIYLIYKIVSIGEDYMFKLTTIKEYVLWLCFYILIIVVVWLGYSILAYNSV